MKIANRIAGFLLIAGTVAGISTYMKMNDKKSAEDGYIGRHEVVVKDGKLTPEILLEMGRLSDPQISPDGRHILYGVTYHSVPMNSTCRNLFICSIDTGESCQVSFSGKSISNARWSNDAKSIIYLMDGQIHTSTLKHTEKGWKIGKSCRRSDIPAGISGFLLNKDQSKLIYTSCIKGLVKSPSDCYTDLDKAEAYTTDDLMYRHWDHTVMEIPHSFITGFKTEGRKKITPEGSTDILGGEPFELPIEPFGGTEQLSWSPDGRYIAYSCKKLSGKKYAFSTDTEIYLYDTVSGKTTVIDMKGGYDTEPMWSPDGKKICWLSMERNGYEADKQRLMVATLGYTEDGLPHVTDITEATDRFKYNAAGPVWSEDSESIYFHALAEGLQGIFVAEAGKDSATWQIRRLTEEDRWNDFGSPFHICRNHDGDLTLYTTWCSMNFPTELVAITFEKGTPVYKQITDENTHIFSQLKEGDIQARYVKTTDGKDMLTWVVYPPEFDPSKTYPSILICLGGPQGTLSQGWSYRWNYRMMAAQGYIVVLPNRRGTTAFGQEWTEQISGDYPGQNIQDYLSAARELKAEPYVGKIAACGASYGGYSVYYLCGVHEGTFDAFIAHAGIFNEEHMYMTTEEMWFINWDNGGLEEYEMDPLVGTDKAPVGAKGDGETFGGIRQGGSPWSNRPEAVRHYALSPHKLVEKWNTPLFVIHGGLDYRVPVDQGMAAYNAAQLMGVPSRLLIFPEENHWILKPQNGLLWHREYFRWLSQWL